MDPLSRFLEHFPDAQPHGHYWKAYCPGHEDNLRSLSISAGNDGRVLLHCHAGCEPEHVIAPLPIQMADLFPSSPDSGPIRSEPEATYDYRDERGELLFQKQRFPGKRFLIRRPSGNGWINKQVFEEGTRRVLYRLPDLLKEPRETVWITEGEKDCDRLWREGLAATTNYEGAGEAHTKSKWRDEYSAWLKEVFPASRFVLLPDNDAAGKSHMAAVAASLTAYGLTAVVVDLPGLEPKGDVSDWLNAGGTCDGLLGLSRPARKRFFFLTFDEVCELPKPVWQADGLYEDQTLVEWYGERSNGKSLLVLDLALTNCKGLTHWCGRQLQRHGAVVWVNADGGRGITKRLRAWRCLHGSNLRYPLLVLGEHDRNGGERMGRARLNSPHDIGELLELIKTLDVPVAMFVFDTLSRSIPGTDENLQGPMTLVTDECHRLRGETGASVHLLHHTDKMGARQRGSDVVPNEADHVIRVTKPQGSRIITVSNDKSRDGELFKPFEMEIRVVEESVVVESRTPLFSSFEPLPAEPEPVVEARPAEHLLAWLQQMPGATAQEIAAASEIPITNVRRYLKELTGQGRARFERGNPTPEVRKPPFFFWATEGS